MKVSWREVAYIRELDTAQSCICQFEKSSGTDLGKRIWHGSVNYFSVWWWLQSVDVVWKCLGTHKMFLILTWWWWFLDTSWWYMHDQIWQWTDGTCSGGAYALNNALLALWLEVLGDDAYMAKWYILLWYGYEFPMTKSHMILGVT